MRDLGPPCSEAQQISKRLQLFLFLWGHFNETFESYIGLDW